MLGAEKLVRSMNRINNYLRARGGGGGKEDKEEKKGGNHPPPHEIDFISTTNVEPCKI